MNNQHSSYVYLICESQNISYKFEVFIVNAVSYQLFLDHSLLYNHDYKQPFHAHNNHITTNGHVESPALKPLAVPDVVTIK